MSKRKEVSYKSKHIRKKVCEEAYREAKPVTFLCKHGHETISDLLWIFRHEENCHIASVYQMAKEGEDVTCDVSEFTKEVVINGLEFIRTGDYISEKAWYKSKEGPYDFVDTLRFFSYIGLDEFIPLLENRIHCIAVELRQYDRHLSFIHAYATRNHCFGKTFNMLLKLVGEYMSSCRKLITPEYDKTFSSLGLYRRIVLQLGDE